MARKKFPRQPYERVKFPLPPGYRESIVVELRYEAPVAPAQDKFVGVDGGEAVAQKLNEMLDQPDVAQIRPSFAVKPRMVAASMNVSAALSVAPPAAAVSTRIERRKDALEPEDFFKSNFARVILKKEGAARELVQRLKRYDSVWDAYVAPFPEPPIYFRPPDVAGGDGPFNLEPTQGYLYSAPDGIGAVDVWDQKGARGEGVTICDIEGGWNLTHEDFPAGIKVLGGTPLDDPEWFNHGTAVLGEMVSVSNAVGTVGIAHRAKVVVQGAFTGSVFNAAQAIDNAASKLKPGDVILIELQSELHGGTGDYVAMQFFSEVFTAVQAAVNNGIVVVAAAGNGNQDFDAAKFKDTGLQKDCGAIVVGAGVPPTNRVDFNGFGAAFPSYASLGAPRSRIFFSNYGKIVNVQGWGWHVSTTGYGDAAGNTTNTQYTFRFTGTSSASPIVTGAVACLQGAAQQVRGHSLTPAQVRKILIDTGTPQAANPARSDFPEPDRTTTRPGSRAEEVIDFSGEGVTPSGLLEPTMVMRKVDPPAGMRPTIHALLKPRWNFHSNSRKFATVTGGQEFAPEHHLPPDTQIDHLVPRLQKGARELLSAEERKLSRWVQIILPRDASAEEYLAKLQTWPFIAEAHIVPPPSLPSPGGIPQPR